MKILLDSCTYLWMLQDSPELSESARRILLEPDQEIYLSTVSLWELSAKHSLGGLSLPKNTEKFFRETLERYSLTELPLRLEAVTQLQKLPHHHKDPFDRMLICQAIAHGLTLLTPDEKIHCYPVLVCW